MAVRVSEVQEFTSNFLITAYSDAFTMISCKDRAGLMDRNKDTLPSSDDQPHDESAGCNLDVNGRDKVIQNQTVRHSNGLTKEQQDCKPGLRLFASEEYFYL